MTPIPTHRLPAFVLSLLVFSLWPNLVLSDDSGASLAMRLMHCTALYVPSGKQSVLSHKRHIVQIATVGAQKLQKQRSALARMTLQA